MDAFSVVCVFGCERKKPLLKRSFSSKKHLHSMIEPYLAMEIGFDVKENYRITIDGRQVKCFDVAFNPVYVESND